MKIFAISGLGADKRVFEYLTLDHELIPVEWIAPKSKETIEVYAKRLVEKYGIGEEPDFGVLGVSFGGLIAMEISKLTKPLVTILISSVEAKDELSGLIKFIGKSRLIELIPGKVAKTPKKDCLFYVWDR